jgi:uncharacterized protein YyaL (SSP411 family)
VLLIAGTGLLTNCGAGSEKESTESKSAGQQNQIAHAGDHDGRPPLPSVKEIAKLPSDGGEDWNRLIFEKSPYLLQHAANPVDWFPWGPDAFAKAKAEDKPVFLSIGYSTCHWCHVMEHESFENQGIAALLNEHFIAIKVDREERPDIDEVYMSAVRAMTRGRGGWPLSAFLTPEAKPFYGGTYFPPEDRYGRPGFRTLLNRLSEGWRSNRAELLKNTDQLMAYLERSTESRGGAEVGEETLDQGAQALCDRYDSAYGGFGEQPKFPTSHTLSFLLRHWKRFGDEQSQRIVEHTLDQMARGGMYDHLGGGFHRYSTDRQWLVPHFEKMLYDQAILARTYIEAFQATGNETYARVARDIFRYVLRDMTGPEGGFYSAEDAASEGEEGTFYLWRPGQILEVLGEDLGGLFNETYGVTETGTFEHNPSILHLSQPLDSVARRLGRDPKDFREQMAKARERLLKERSERIRPLRDDKVITSWNALMISAFAYASQALADPEYRQAAERAADFVLERLQAKDGRLLRRYREGEAALPGYIDDYAFFVNALIDVYEATFETRYLAESIRLTEKMEELFWDKEDGGFAFKGTDGEQLIIRPKKTYDGAIPSGNSIAALALYRLGSLTADPKYERRARQVIDAFSNDIARGSTGHTQMLIALDYGLGPTVEVVVAGEPGAKDVRRMIRTLHERFIPNKVVALRPGGKAGKEIALLAPFLSEQEAIDGKATAYVCRNHACSLPTQDPTEMVVLIEDDGRPRQPGADD